MCGPRLREPRGEVQGLASRRLQQTSPEAMPTGRMDSGRGEKEAHASDTEDTQPPGNSTRESTLCMTAQLRVWACVVEAWL